MTSASILFLCICAFVVWVFIYFVRHSASQTFSRRTISIFLTWVLLSGLIGISGFAKDFSTIPPKFAIILVPAFTLSFLFSFGSGIKDALRTINPFHLIAFQAFRIAVEIVLWLLYRDNTIPIQMSFEGSNFDILAGITAPFIAYFCFKKKSLPLIIAQIWNYVCLALLCNIIVVALVSTPTIFRLYMNEPANTLVATFPYIWIPAFVAPMAMVGHILSLRQLSLLRLNGTQPV